MNNTDFYVTFGTFILVCFIGFLFIWALAKLLIKPLFRKLRAEFRRLVTEPAITRKLCLEFILRHCDTVYINLMESRIYPSEPSECGQHEYVEEKTFINQLPNAPTYADKTEVEALFHDARASYIRSLHDIFCIDPEVSAKLESWLAKKVMFVKQRGKIRVGENEWNTKYLCYRPAEIHGMNEELRSLKPQAKLD